MKLSTWINVWKLATLPYIVILATSTHRSELRIWLYTALHGAYGILWCLKDCVAPDMQFHTDLDIIMAIKSTIYLCIYLITPTMLVFTPCSEIRPIEVVVWVVMYAVGVFLHFGSDVQKYYVLRQEKKLITNGFFTYMKHPNYIGEGFIYLSFCGVSGLAVSYILLAFQVLVGWMPYIHKKELSMSRYKEWDAYSRRCWV